jgi:hypothetical protein
MPSPFSARDAFLLLCGMLLASLMGLAYQGLNLPM